MINLAPSTTGTMNMPLVKTAMAGEDVNRGRIMEALGRAGARFDPEKVEIAFGEQVVVKEGRGRGPGAEAKAQQVIKAGAFHLHLMAINSMKKCLFLLIAVLFTNFYPLYSSAQVLKKYHKVIWINQEEQVGAAYGRGRKLVEFPILTGDDETPTPPGTYVIKSKVRHYHSRKYDTPMPYSLFFDYRGRAIHEGDVADPEEKSEWATHGCIHVEQPYMEWLYNWAETGKTVVVVKGRRVWEDEVRGETEAIREDTAREETVETEEDAAREEIEEGQEDREGEETEE